MTSAQERWTQRILDGLGARPVGHGAPDDGDGPHIPAQSPVPPPPPGARPSPRLPDWWSTSRPNIPGTPAPAAGGDDEDDEGEPVSKNAGTAAAPPPPSAPPAAPPPSPAPAAAPATGSGGGQPDNSNRTTVRIAMGGVVEDRYARVIIFNLTAGGVGYTLGLVDTFGRFLPVAEAGAVGMVSIFTAAAGALAAWRITRAHAIQAILPVPPVSRTIIAAGAAGIGQQFAEPVVDWINAHGERWGLGGSAVSLLLTAGAMSGGLWWFLDRRIRHWHWTARWLCRIPLASALLATALYAPGVPS